MCRGYNELKQIDADSQTYREQRKNEMHKLYKLLNSENIKGLLLYRWYLQSRLELGVPRTQANE